MRYIKPSSGKRNTSILRRVLWARGLRAFGDGYTSLVLPVYLTSLVMSAFQVGVIATGTLLGSAMLTLLIGMQAHRFKYRNLLVAAAAMMVGTGVGVAFVTDFWPLLVVAVVGTLNPSSGDVSVFLPLEHAVLSRVGSDRQRTAVFARYSLVGSLVAAVGALCAGLPDLLTAAAPINMNVALKAMFILYGLLGLASALIYSNLPPHVETNDRTAAAPLKESKRRVYTLAALFSIDSFGGGLVVQSIFALWLFQKFALSTATTGLIFFWSGVLSALSYLAAARIARKVGLINTMVFSHLPSSIFLLLIPFMPSLGWAIALLMARSALSQMDVPTRSSYVMAVVPKAERAAAASPALAGYLLTLSPFGWPLVIAGGLKIAYDLLLFGMFRSVRPPEEAKSNG
jgi:MFS family permease